MLFVVTGTRSAVDSAFGRSRATLDEYVPATGPVGFCVGTIAIVPASNTVGDVIAALGRAAPFDKAAGWDPVGLQVGDPGGPATRVGICHEVTEAVVGAVESDPVDLLITYHPLLFDPVRGLVAGRHPQGRALRLARAGVALAVVHTAFDVAPGGAADALAAALGLVETSGFGPLWGRDSVKVVTFAPEEAVAGIVAAMSHAGAGTIGGYSGCSFRSRGTGTFAAPSNASPAVGTAGESNTAAEIRVEMVAPASRVEAVASALVAAHPYEEPAYDIVERRGDAGFVGRVGRLTDPATVVELGARVAEVLGGVVRVAAADPGPVHRVGVVPGSGGDLLASAADCGAHVVVTGDVGHHRARGGLDRGLSIIDPGHAATERPGLESLYAAVSAIAAEVRDLRQPDADPWRPAR